MTKHTPIDIDSLIDSIFASIQNNPIGIILNDPRMRPSNFEEMYSDIKRLIKKMAEASTDPSCVHLHTDELEGECALKIAKLCHTGRMDKFPNRDEAFKYIKTTLANHIRGLVQRHRFTQKRTGIKAPPKGSFSMERSKPIEMSLDDPELGIQVGESAVESDIELDELKDDFKRRLNPLESVVLDQLVRPNRASFVLAELSYRKEVDKINISYLHKAQGLGMELDLFHRVLQAIKVKFQNYMKVRDTEADLEWQTAISQLEIAFGVEAPAGVDPIVIRRMFSIAARHRPDKAIGVTALLIKIGARVPKSGNPTDVCFGILYDAGHRVCQGCGLREECRVESTNLELTSIRLHPDVLGAHVIRVAAPIDVPDEVPVPVVEPPIAIVIPRRMPAVPEVEPNDRNDAIIRFMQENFKMMTIDSNRTGFCHKEGGNLRYTPSFVAQNTTVGMCLKFCCPSDALMEKLLREPKGRSYRLPDDVSVKQAIKLIDQHSKDRLIDQDLKDKAKAATLP